MCSPSLCPTAHLPEDRATSFMAISRLSPSTYAKEKLTQPVAAPDKMQASGLLSNHPPPLTLSPPHPQPHPHLGRRAQDLRYG